MTVVHTSSNTRPIHAQHATDPSFFQSQAASEKAAGVLTLFNALYWLFFAVSDGSMVVLGTLPPNFPKDSIAGNCFLFLIMASVNFNAWVGAGSPKPDFGKMKPGGPLATPLMVMMFNLLGFGVGCAFFTEQFVDQFNPGLLSKFNPGARGAIILMVGNAGKMMLFNILVSIDRFPNPSTHCFISQLVTVVHTSRYTRR